MKEYEGIIIKSERIAENVHMLVFDVGEEVKARCGRFVNLSTGGMRLLRRPIAICKAEGSEITVCFQIKGDGTKALSSCKKWDKISALLPLGNGFFVKDEEKKVALVGGGVGVFPMVSVIREYYKDKRIFSYVGFKNSSAFCMKEELEKSEKLTVVTDDGSLGQKMNAVEALVRDLDEVKPDVILSCGPIPMLRALKEALKGKNIPCYVSLEERMGCGIGACLVCVCDKTNGERARVCKDGPVFDIEEVEL